MASNSALARLNLLFSAKHVPVREIKSRVQHKTLPVNVPTSKTPSGMIRASKALMADGIMHAETDPNVLAIAAYPMAVQYWSYDEPDGPMKLEHIADVALKMRDGSIVFVDYKPLVISGMNKTFEARTRDRKAHYHLEFGCSYCLLDERHLRIEPLWSNVKLMWQHRPIPSDTGALSRAQILLRGMQLPATISEIAKSVTVPQLAMRWGPEGSQQPFSDINLVFTSVMHLAMQGEVKLDLGKPLSMNSIVRRVG